MDSSYLLAFLLISSSLAWAENGDFGACGLCERITDALRGYENASFSKEVLWTELDASSLGICDEVSSFVVSKEECISFIRINGGYYLDQFVSRTKLDEICKNMGFCEGASPEYKIIFPRIKNDSITYTISETNYLEETEFKYKIFLGDIAFLSDQSYALSSVVDPISVSEVLMQVSTGHVIRMKKGCNDKMKCYGEIPRPGKGLWFHITIRARATGENPSFTLTLSEHNSVAHWEYEGSQYSFVRFVVLLILGLLALCSVCFALTRCLFCMFNQDRRGYYYHALKGDTRQPIMVFVDEPSMNIPYSYAGNHQFPVPYPMAE